MNIDTNPVIVVRRHQPIVCFLMSDVKQSTRMIVEVNIVDTPIVHKLTHVRIRRTISLYIFHLT
jgi:hypothetical protein